MELLDLFMHGTKIKKLEGEQEIKAITEGKDIAMEIRFVRHFAGIANARMTAEPLWGADRNRETKVS